MQVGIDIIEIDRLNEIVSKREKIKKIFTKNEIDYCNKFLNKLEHFAGFFSAKESFAKALKCGFGKELGLLDVEILHEPSGAPYVNVLNDKLRLKLKNNKIELSISHSNSSAVSVCIIY